MKNLFIMLVLVAFSAQGFSQSDQKAVDLLNSLSTKVNAYKSLNIEFKFYVENLKDASRTMYPGKVWYRGDRYKLDLMGQVVFSDGKTNWTYLKDAEEINITNANDADATIFNPQSLLANFTKDYKCRWISDKFVNNRAIVEIDLYPIKIEGKKYSKITLRIDKTKTQLYTVHYVGKDGVSYLVEIDKFLENPTIADKDIVFSATSFPGAEVIDMR
ncbi:MAG TPA: outer membrane lipoprotein carrier protein LolA [Bacteroidales bacterium]|nr:outer membrane lipoprotein carrier protein LolA [Bacteroidales bacterium]